MEYFQGSSFYDNEDVFERYIRHRKWTESPNKVIEKPVVLELLDGIGGHVLDLGCGYGDIATELLEKGANQYTGIDSSSKMITLGQSQIKHPKVELLKSDIQQHNYPDSTYDWVIARLVFHYIEDLGKLLRKVHNSLKQNGKLVFSVEHPVLTSSMDLPRTPGKKQSWIVDQYFDIGVRNQAWMNNKVQKYHRTLEEYWRIVTQAGFRVEMIKEGKPNADLFQNQEEYERRKRIPLFLIIKAEKG